MPLAATPELMKLLQEAVEAFNKLSPEEQEKVYQAQRESWVRSVMLWPKPKYKWVDGVKVYDSIEDYHND
jgi:hypothetical protein